MPIEMLDRERLRLGAAVRTALTAVGFLWLLHLLRLGLGMSAGSWGVLPRRLDGLHGVLTGPLAHADVGHLANNSVPLAATILLLVYFFPRIAARALLVLYVGTGAAVWALARGAGWGAEVTISHVGASGVAYALVSFLFWLGVFKRSPQSVVVALIILIYFSGMIAGVLPDQLNVSWESHLLGGVVGALVAWGFRASVVDDRAADEPPEPAYVSAPYFPPDTFAYTLAEREAMRRRALEAERERRRTLDDLARRARPDDPPPAKLW